MKLALMVALASLFLPAVSAARGDAAARARADEPAAIAVTRAGAPHVDIAVSAGELDLGEPFVAVIRARHATDVQVGVLDALALGPAIEEIRRVSASRRNPDGTVTREVEIVLVAFEIGTLALPAIPVHYETTERSGLVLTEQVALRVRDPLAGEDATLRDIAPPVVVERQDLTWVYAGLAAALAGALVVLIGRLRRRSTLRGRAAAPAAPLPAPDEEALANLEALAASGALDASDRRPAYFEMSEIVRVYLGRRYGFAALDLTTHEIRDSLAASAGASARTLVLAWLEDVDGVKYAGYRAGADEARDTLDRAVDLVLEIRGAGGETDEVGEVRG